MFNRLADWFDQRIGYRPLVQGVLDGPIPGGARWRYTLGVALATALFIQFVTGVLMMFTYVPSPEMAWGSVYFINERMLLGWFVRGLHHFGSQATVVVLGLHLLQVLIAGAYRAPRETNWWIGLVLMVLILGLGATGYQLPWDQKGYWSTKIAANFAGGVPVIGEAARKVAVGGTEFGYQTLTRFFALHVAVMPGLVVFLLTIHVILFHRYGVTAPRSERPVTRYWPEQAFKDATASFIFTAGLAAIVLFFRGATLDAPADPSSADYPARPEWYFLPMYQMLKHFPGDREVIGTVVIPGAIMAVMFLLPFLDRILPGKLAHFLACCFVFALFGGAGYFIYESLKADASDPGFKIARDKADMAMERALTLANDPNVGVPPDGATYLLLRDPLYHGRSVFEAKCLGCHVFDGKGVGTQVASDLKDYGSRAWLRGMLEAPSSPRYFGKVPKCDGMAEWKKGSKLSAKELDDVADFVASFAKIKPDTTVEEWQNEPGVAEHPGLKPFQKECGTCHVIEGLSEGGVRDAPQLFAWGSRQWLARMIRKPGATDMYGFLDATDQMPPFAEQLSENDVNTVIRYLGNDYSGAPASRVEKSP